MWAQAVVDRAQEQEALYEAGDRGRSEVREAFGRGGHSGTDQCVGVGTRLVACSPSDPWNPRRKLKVQERATFPLSRTSHPCPFPTCKTLQVG